MLLNEEVLLNDSTPQFSFRSDMDYKRVQSIINDEYFNYPGKSKSEKREWEQSKNIIFHGSEASYIIVLKTLSYSNGLGGGTELLLKGHIKSILAIYDIKQQKYTGIIPIEVTNDDKISYTQRSGDWNAESNAIRSDLTHNLTLAIEKAMKSHFVCDDLIPYIK